MYRANRMTWIKALGVSVLAVFAPIESMLISVGVLIVADLAFGLIASYKLSKPITSSGIRRTVTKSFIYLSVVCLGYVAEHYLIGDLLPVCKIIAGMIGVVEMKSILENADIINGGSVFKAVVAKLGSENDKLQNNDSSGQ